MRYHHFCGLPVKISYVDCFRRLVLEQITTENNTSTLHNFASLLQKRVFEH